MVREHGSERKAEAKLVDREKRIEAFKIRDLDPMGHVNNAVFFTYALVLTLLAYALYSQFHLHLEPCPLCIFQRIGIALTGVLFLIAALHHPRRGGRLVYAALIGLAALPMARRARGLEPERP